MVERLAAQRAISTWHSEALSPAAQEAVRSLVAGGAPVSRSRAKALLFACSRLVAFAESVGVELDGPMLLSDATVERLIAEGCAGLSPASVRTLRTNLRALARARERYPQPARVSLPRERAKRPYSAAEIDGYLRLARAQSTEARRMRATALVCLGAGAGVIASELRHLRGLDVIERASGSLVRVDGRRARTVPVLERYRQPLSEAAVFAGAGLIVGGRDPARRNISDELCAALSADRSLPRLESGRLRSTWLVECAAQIGLGAFMQAAGIRCSQRLGDLAAQLPPAGEAELLARLGGHA